MAVEITFGKGMVKDTFTSKSGTEMSRIVIAAGQDGDGKTRWEDFAVPSYLIKPYNENSVIMTLDDDASVKLTHDEPIGDVKPDGKPDYVTVTREVSAAELKGIMEFYKVQAKEQSAPADRFTVTCRASFVRPYTMKNGEPYRNKSGRQVFSISIPNGDPEDKTPWREFSMDERFVHPAGKLTVDLDIPNISELEVTRSIKTDEGWDKQAEKIPVDELTELLEAPPTITMSCTAKLVGDPFETSRGRQCQRVYIPNRDEEDHRPWESFFINSDNISVNGRNPDLCDITVFEGGHTKLSRPQVEGQDEQGRDIYAKDQDEKTIYDTRWVPNEELKDIVEAYKTQGREEEDIDELPFDPGDDAKASEPSL